MTVDELELYFETFGYPNEDIEILPGQYVLCANAKFFVESTILTLRTHSGNKRYKPYYDRLVLYYKKCKLIK
jgi:hypothetical protein